MKLPNALEQGKIKTFVSIMIFKIWIAIISVLLFLFLPINEQNSFYFIITLIEDCHIDFYVFVRLVLTVVALIGLLISAVKLIKIMRSDQKYIIDADVPPQQWIAMRVRELFIIVMGLNELLSCATFSYTIYMYENEIEEHVFTLGGSMVLMFAPLLLYFLIARKNRREVSKYLNHYYQVYIGFQVEEVSNKKEPAVSMSQKTENLDALLQYKKLYESGAITEEEYEAKKTELLK